MNRLAQAKSRSNCKQIVAYYYTRDHLGSVRELVNSSGTLLTRYSYDPYGRATANYLVTSPSTTDATFQYTGDYYHAASGLNLTLFRAYDPNTAKWLSRDPVGERGGLNLYGYVRNNTINSIDPLGLCGCSSGLSNVVVLAGLAAVAAIATAAGAPLAAAVAAGGFFGGAANMFFGGDAGAGALAGALGVVAAAAAEGLGAAAIVAGIVGGGVSGGLGSGFNALENGFGMKDAAAAAAFGVFAGGTTGGFGAFAGEAASSLGSFGAQSAGQASANNTFGNFLGSFSGSVAGAGVDGGNEAIARALGLGCP